MDPESGGLPGRGQPCGLLQRTENDLERFGKPRLGAGRPLERRTQDEEADQKSAEARRLRGRGASRAPSDLRSIRNRIPEVNAMDNSFRTPFPVFS